MAYIRIKSFYGGQPAGKTGTHDCRTLRGLERILRTYREGGGWDIHVYMSARTAKALGAWPWRYGMWELPLTTRVILVDIDGGGP